MNEGAKKSENPFPASPFALLSFLE